MRISLLFIILFVLINSNLSQAQNSLLWKISGNGVEKPSYLFGTYHLMSPEFLDSIPGFFQAIESTNEIVVEVDVSDQEKIKSEVFKFVNLLKMPSDTAYADLLTLEELQLVDSVFTLYFQATSDDFMLKPQVAAVFITQMLYVKLIPEMYTGTSVVFDEYIRSKGVKLGKKSSALETLDEQMKLLYQSELTLQEDAIALINFIQTDLKDFESDLNRLKFLYKNKDLNALHDLYSEKLQEKRIQFGDKYVESADELFLKKRNKNWVKLLSSKLKESSLFIAVGALHLPGKEGVIELLQKQGFVLEPIN